ncbi:unnamed protein product [Prorocentrum cordatum]|uniref:Uncharacterized protein n=1 Tax=Prorocentrum cordatum TaxID=2364126 RepID=A0ABN9PWQ0_9DINO|nr:unnamed protein product [Polarella glacialis]
MQMWGAISALVVVAGTFHPAAAAEANPLGKVLELLNKLSEKVTTEGESADKAYNTYVEWCDDAASEKRHEIKSSTSKKQKLESSIDKLSADITICDSKINQLAESAASASKDRPRRRHCNPEERGGGIRVERGGAHGHSGQTP